MRFTETMQVTCCVCLWSQSMSFGSLCVCFQRKGACHTVNHRSPPPVGTAPLVQPPPRAQQGRARTRAHDSHYSGLPQSMLTSWGPTDRSSTRGSYVSNSRFCCFTMHNIACMVNKNPVYIYYTTFTNSSSCT